MNKEEVRSEKYVYAKIGAYLGAFLTAMTAIVMIFDSGQAWVIVPTAFAFVILGIFLAHYAQKK